LVAKLREQQPSRPIVIAMLDKAWLMLTTRLSGGSGAGKRGKRMTLRQH
jgi:hypothetical protein